MVTLQILVLSFLVRIQVAQRRKEVCRNARCTFFFIHYYTTRFIFFKLRYFEDFFDLCVLNI